MSRQKLKKKFRVEWSRTYVAHGEETVFAASKEEAETEAWERLAQWEGSMQVVPDEDRVFVYSPLDLWEREDGTMQPIYGSSGRMRVNKHDADADGDEQLERKIVEDILDPHHSEFDKLAEEEEEYEEDEQ